MPRPSTPIRAASIAENLLKRKWSVTILRYVSNGVHTPSKISALEPDLSLAVLGERLRTMARYSVIARFPQPSPSKVVEYRLTPRGKKVLSMFDILDQLDRDL